MRPLPEGVKPEWVRDPGPVDYLYRHSKYAQQFLEDVAEDVYFQVTELDEVWLDGLTYGGLGASIDTSGPPPRHLNQPRRAWNDFVHAESVPAPSPQPQPQKSAVERCSALLLRDCMGKERGVTLDGWVYDKDGIVCSYRDYMAFISDNSGV